MSFTRRPVFSEKHSGVDMTLFNLVMDIFKGALYLPKTSHMQASISIVEIRNCPQDFLRNFALKGCMGLPRAHPTSTTGVNSRQCFHSAVKLVMKCFLAVSKSIESMLSGDRPSTRDFSMMLVEGSSNALILP
jgi:hypothetical protein